MHQVLHVGLMYGSLAAGAGEARTQSQTYQRGVRGGRGGVKGKRDDQGQSSPFVEPNRLFSVSQTSKTSSLASFASLSRLAQVATGFLQGAAA